jgi:TatD DNase family protein
MLIDTHCHLDAARFDEDRAAMIARARAAGVVRMMTIGCSVENSERALGLAKTHADVFCSVGVHPHEAASAAPDFIDALRSLARHPKVRAIGECGLDYYYDHSPRDVQQGVFRAQIVLARELSMPLVIHVRDAWEDCLRILDDERAERVLIHCFTGTRENADASIARGYMLSIPGVITFKDPGALHEVVKNAPVERLLVETDSPYLAPMPHRGKRNEPAFVRHVAEKVAELRGLSVDDVVRTTGMNAMRFFALP